MLTHERRALCEDRAETGDCWELEEARKLSAGYREQGLPTP